MTVFEMRPATVNEVSVCAARAGVPGAAAAHRVARVAAGRPGPPAVARCAAARAAGAGLLLGARLAVLTLAGFATEDHFVACCPGLTLACAHAGYWLPGVCETK